MFKKFKDMDIIRKLNIIFVAVFLLAMLLPYVFARRPQEGLVSDKENRVLAAYPKLISEGQFNMEYFTDFENWLQDNLRGRSTIVKINTALQYDLFDRVVKTDNVNGVNEWLFNNSDEQVLYDIDQNSMEEEQIRQYAERIQTISDHVKSLGCDFYYFIPNAKETVYPEEYAKGVNLAEKHDVDRLMEVFEEMGSDVKAIYCLDTMKEHKDEYIYYRYSDTVHWNSLGAYYGYRLLMDTVHADHEEVPVLSLDDYTGEEMTEEAYLYDFKYPYEDKLTEYELTETHAVDITDQTIGNYQGTGVMSYTSEFTNPDSSNDLRVMLIGDSFFRMFLKDDIAESFAETLSVDYQNLQYIDQFIETYQPDIIMFESVDINTNQINNFLTSIGYE